MLEPSISTGDSVKTNPIYHHLRHRFWRHRWRFLIALGLVLLHAALPSGIVFLIQGILDDALIQKDESRLLWLPLALIGIYGLNGLVAYSRGMLTRSIAWEIVTNLRRDVFAHVLSLSLAWRQKQQAGQILSRVMNDISNVQYLVSAIITLIHHPLTIVGLLATAFYMNAKLALICLFVLPFVAILIQRFGRRLRGSAQNELDQQADLQSMATETLLGFSAIQAGQAEKVFSKRFADLNEQLRLRKIQHISAQLIPGPVVEFVAALGIGLTILFGGRQVLDGTLQPGELIAFLVAMGLLNAPIKAISEAQSLWQRAMAGAQAAVLLLNESSPSDTGSNVLESRTITVSIQDLSFSYRPEVPIIEHLSFNVPAQQITALSGVSGVGKSTIADLILRRYQFDEKAILLNGKPVNSYTRDSLYKHVAIIQQQPFIFRASVSENIRLGGWSSESAVVEAAKRADAHDFIQSLPNGYDTILTESGDQLSGGQRQRICIARAFLRNAPLLILDEATSNLDEESQKSILTTLKTLMVSRTVLLISHDPRLLAAAHQVVEL